MKTNVKKMMLPLIYTIAVLSFCSCSNKLDKDEAETLISIKYKLPYDDIVPFDPPEVEIWTQDWDYYEGGYDDFGCKKRCQPSKTIDEIIASGQYSNMAGFEDRNNLVSWQQTYITVVNENLEWYKKYKDLGIIQFDSYYKGQYAAMNSGGQETRNVTSSSYFEGNYWGCKYKLTSKANELGIHDWQYKAAEWVFDDIKGIFNDEEKKTAEVDFTIRTVNPTSTAKFFGEWKEKIKNLKAKFKLYDDGWRIEE